MPLLSHATTNQELKYGLNMVLLLVAFFFFFFLIEESTGLIQTYWSVLHNAPAVFNAYAHWGRTYSKYSLISPYKERKLCVRAGSSISKRKRRHGKEKKWNVESH